MLTNKILQVLLGGDEPGNEAQFCPAESLRIWDISIPGSSVQTNKSWLLAVFFFILLAKFGGFLDCSSIYTYIFTYRYGMFL